MPLGLGFGLALFRSRRSRARIGPTLERGALATVLLSFALLFPNAYYYGATRAVLLALVIALIVVLATRARALPSQGRRLAGAGLVLALVALIWSLYGLRDVGGRTREMAYFVFSSPLFDRYGRLTSCAVKVGLWLYFALDARRSRRDLSAAAIVLLLASWLECSSVAGARYVLLPALLGYLALSVVPKHRYVVFRFCLGLLAIGQFYAAQPLALVPMQVLFLMSLLVLEACQLFFEHDAGSGSAAKGVILALLGYLLLWPTVGMRFSGIDFRFMFDWVPVARYEELWWLIGLGMLLKFSLPYALLIDLGRRSATGQTLSWVYVTLVLKLTALSVFAAWYSTSHALLTNGALEILAELALLILASALAWPSPLRALSRSAAAGAGPRAQRVAPDSG